MPQLEKYTLIQSDPREVGITIIQRRECSLEVEAHKKRKEIHKPCVKLFLKLFISAAVTPSAAFDPYTDKQNKQLHQDKLTLNSFLE